MLLANLAAFYGTRLLDTGAPVHSMATAPDARIPFVPAMIVVYLLAFVQWALGYLVLVHEPPRVCRRYACAMVLAQIISAACFLLCPTVMTDRPVPEGADLFSRLTALVFSMDAPDHLFPSLHCLESWMFMRITLASGQVRRPLKIFSVLFTSAVFASVVLVKQHYLADIPGGIAVAELGLLLTAPLFRQPKPAESE